MRKSVFASISIFETSLSAAEWMWRIGTLILIGGTGTISALMAKADPLLKQLGPIYWLAIGLALSLVVALIVYLVKSAALKQSLVDINRTLSAAPNHINPLASSFEDVIISVDALRLPTTQVHENKNFRRCKFVGPAALAIFGGIYTRNNFLQGGDIVALPNDVKMSGIVILKNCTVEDCDFVRISVFTSQGSADAFVQGGASVKGIV